MLQDNVVKQLADALQAAQAHLEYCGYGDRWERECAEQGRLAEKVDGALDAARGAGWEPEAQDGGGLPTPDTTPYKPDALSYPVPKRPARSDNWHRRRRTAEPRCGRTQWRTRDRMNVIDIAAMDLARVQACIAFAKRFPMHHRSRLPALERHAERLRAGVR